MNRICRFFSLVILIFYICIASPALSADATGENKLNEKAPSVFFPEPRFEFDQMVEGKEVLHNFVIMNKGTDLLKVKKVKSSCGCTTVSYSKEIPPGKEGKITMKLNTRGYGGRKLTKTITVMTNDPATPNTTLTVTGNIEKFVTIHPSIIRLNGKIGDELKSVVKIIPEKAYPFSITKIRAKNGKYIKYELQEESSVSGTKEYRVIVENMKQDAGTYFDRLILETDSKIRPKIQINVMARLTAPNAPAKVSRATDNGGSKGANGAKSFLEAIQKMQRQKEINVNGNNRKSIESNE